MEQRFILNETSYFGRGCRVELVNEIKNRGYKKALFVTDKTLLECGVAKKVSDILDEDVLCQYGDDENKFVLYDKFLCIEEGTILGEVSPDVIKQMPKAN